MGLLRAMSRLSKQMLGLYRGEEPGSNVSRLRICRYEDLELRSMLVSDLHVAAVYLDPASGTDGVANLIQITFQGGAPGTELTHISIDGSKNGGPLFFNDAVFDTAPGGIGAYQSHPLDVVAHDGFQVLGTHVEDGSTLLTFDLQGFTAGEKLIFKIDVDQVIFVDGDPAHLTVDAVDEGAEFERSKFVTTFVAPHFQDVTTSTLFWDKYDSNFAAADSTTGTHLDLPPDRYDPNVDLSVLTAGAVAQIAQTPLPITLAGTVYEDKNSNNQKNLGDPGIAGVQLTLLQLSGGDYANTGKTATTDASGNYKFSGLLPGTYRVVETQPTGYYSIGASAGTVGGATDGVVTTPDILSQITLLGGDDSIQNNFAEALPGLINGYVHDGSQGDWEVNPSAPPIAGVSVQLLSSAGVVLATTTTNATGFYSFGNLAPGTYGVHEIQPNGWYQGDQVLGSAGGSISAVDTMTQIVINSGVQAVKYDFNELLPASIGGKVQIDADGNCNTNPNEPPIAGVTIQLLDKSGAVLQSTVTDANGKYTFTNIAPNQNYTVHEIQPAGYFQEAAHVGDSGGQIQDVDTIINVPLGAGVVAFGYNFCELLPASISGKVQIDADGNCDTNPNEPPIAGVTIQLLDASGKLLQTTVTDANGMYTFSQLAPKTVYTVHEIQPTGYFQEAAHVGTAGGTIQDFDTVIGINPGGGQNATGYNFCELLPASISGKVQIDADGACDTNPDEPPIAGVTIQLLDKSGALLQSTVTDANGKYTFTNIAPNQNYTVHEIQPTGYFQEEAHVGSAGGTILDVDTVINIHPGGGENATGYNFCELLPANISGKVQIDVDGLCGVNPNEPPIAGVSVHLLDANGHVLQSTVTDAAGMYSFTKLPPEQTYSVSIDQPAGYFAEDSHAGTAGGVSINPRLIGEITLHGGASGKDYDFCELLPASIEGHVNQNTGGDCLTGPAGPPIAGVTIQLLDANGQIIATTKTDANGEYKFTGLAPNVIYGVHEVQPAGFFQGDQHTGSAGGIVAADDLLAEIFLGPGIDATDYDFCELPPAELCGYVYVDANNNGVRETGETGIAGVKLLLLDANGAPTGATVSTDSTGFYCFENLPPGTYQISELQPVGYYDGLDAPGTSGGVAHNPGDSISDITLVAGIDADDYNFGELLPASIAGQVHVDLNNNCVLDPGEPTLPGVTMQLTDAAGNVLATTVTDANGRYSFNNLQPGTYGVHKIPPAGYFDGGNTVGSVGGTLVDDDTIANVTIGSDVRAVDYDFCELPPASISGTVFQDGPVIFSINGDAPDVPSVRDGVLTGDDTRLGGVTLELRNGVTGEPIMGSTALPGFYAPDQPIRTVTDESGHYAFHGLPAGNYGVFEIPPDGYIPGIDTAGSHGGVVVSRYNEVSPLVLQALTVGVDNNDAILRIGVGAGQESVNNWFSVVKVVGGVFVLPTPLQMPAPVPTPQLVINVPPPINPALSPLMMLVAPNRLDGSASVINYTWHLSVIDAGRPRNPGADDAEVKLTAITDDDLAKWDESHMEDSEWTLGDAQRGNARKRLFGMRGATAITGDFNGDGVTDVGVFKNGEWYIDLNGNGVWDAGDLWAKLGHDGDKPVTGDWNGDGKTDIGIFGPAWAGDPRAIKAEPGLPDVANKPTGVHKNVPPPPHLAAVGVRALKLSSQGKARADLIDHVFHYGTPRDIPVVGDWNGDGIDSIAVFSDGSFYRDVDGDGKWSVGDEKHDFGQKGDKPVVGDFDGDGIDEIGVYRDGVWYLDTNHNGKLDPADRVVRLGQPGDKPVVGDWDGDGQDEPGVYRDGDVIAGPPTE